MAKAAASDVIDLSLAQQFKDGTAEKVEGLEPSDGDWEVRLSPDGRFLAYFADIKDKTSGKTKTYIRVVKFADGQAGEKILEREAPDVPRLRWTLESDTLIYEKENEQRNLYKLKLSDQTETQISNFNQNTDTGTFIMSEDGKRVLVFRVSRIDTIVRITDAGDD